jgi:hypothetical protein
MKFNALMAFLFSDLRQNCALQKKRIRRGTAFVGQIMRPRGAAESFFASSRAAASRRVAAALNRHI